MNIEDTLTAISESVVKNEGGPRLHPEKQRAHTPPLFYLFLSFFIHFYFYITFCMINIFPWCKIHII